MVLSEMLGLRPDPAGRRLIVSPSFPSWLRVVTINGIEALGRQFTLTVRRDNEDYVVECDGPIARTDRLNSWKQSVS
jgi:hypothetical protein